MLVIYVVGYLYTTRPIEMLVQWKCYQIKWGRRDMIILTGIKSFSVWCLSANFNESSYKIGFWNRIHYQTKEWVCYASVIYYIFKIVNVNRNS